jgi:hypothetical protein
MTKRLVLNITLAFFFLIGINSQEVISGLQTNIIITKARETLDKSKRLTVPDTIELPLFDDFSQSGVFPDNKYWSDNYVFINNTFSNQQITAGMATFDAIDQTGKLYEWASSSVFKADHLTSNPVNLDYPASDSIYLSFFYQPQGLADAPERNDSLTLQFFAPSENKWHSVWMAYGSSNKPFKPVIIKIDQSRYLKKGFSFRFINYASLSSDLNDPAMAGNCDQWNIDYILLDKNRSNGDTLPADVAFTLPLRSSLKTYEAMPWRHFRQVFLSEMGPWIKIHYRNNDDIVRNVTRNFEIYDLYKQNLSHSFTSGATNIDPMTDINYNAELIYSFKPNEPDNPDSALFRITAILKTDDFDRKDNDTIIYYQKFGNYFAFDDGSAEGGYGINGLGSRNAMVAYRFKSFIPDSLRAIQICFNDSYLNSNLRSFDLMVWSDNNGVPGDILYSQEEEMVSQGSAINGFTTYKLNQPVKVTGVFYIGWKQRSETFLNAGFDFNTLHNGRQFYWINGNWTLSQAKGSLMIRAVVGTPVKTTLISDVPGSGYKKLGIWPNPVKEFLSVEADETGFTGNLTISIFDLQGRRLMLENYNERLDVSFLKEGIYVIILYDNNKPLRINRFIKLF